MRSNIPPEAQYQRNTGAGIEHILPRVVTLVTTGSPPSQIGADEFQRMVDHLNGCGVCQAGLIALANVSAFPMLDALMAHAKYASGVSDDLDEELAAYAIIADTEGVPVANKRLPRLVTHLGACPICREMLAETQAALAQFAGTSSSYGAEARDEIVNSPQTVWQRTDAQTSRLASDYQIYVESMSVRITSTLPFHQIRTDYTDNVRFLDKPGPCGDTVSAQQGQSFAVDLRDDVASPQPWTRVRVSWRALFTGRISGEIRALLVAAPDDDEANSEVASAIPWHIERWRDDGLSQAVASGATDVRGITRFTFHDYGQFTLTLTADGRDWQIPFTVAPEIHPETGA